VLDPRAAAAAAFPLVLRHRSVIESSGSGG
jgi:hypothetical protein